MHLAPENFIKHCKKLIDLKVLPKLYFMLIYPFVNFWDYWAQWYVILFRFLLQMNTEWSLTLPTPGIRGTNQCLTKWTAGVELRLSSRTWSADAMLLEYGECHCLPIGSITKIWCLDDILWRLIVKIPQVAPDKHHYPNATHFITVVHAFLLDISCVNFQSNSLVC